MERQGEGQRDSGSYLPGGRLVFLFRKAGYKLYVYRYYDEPRPYLSCCSFVVPRFDILIDLRSFLEEHLETAVVAQVQEGRRKQAEEDAKESHEDGAQSSPLRLDDIKLGIKSR